jgi:hypothetical protein
MHVARWSLERSADNGTDEVRETLRIGCFSGTAQHLEGGYSILGDVSGQLKPCT